MHFFDSCIKSTVLFGQSIGEEALLSGISDVIVVKYPNGFYKSTPFLACFGSHCCLYREELISIQVNDGEIIQTKNKVNRHGYMSEVHMTQEEMRKMDLKWGRNSLKYLLSGQYIEAELYMLKITDKILISDFDGTLTINDFGGLVGGIFDFDFMHLGYDKLLQELEKRGVFLVWITMRSMPFYNCSKNYLFKYVKTKHGILLMEPEQFLPAVKKELFKKTGNIKANMIKKLSELFPVGVQPFVGGLGNREGDAVAYLNIGIEMEFIYLVSSETQVQRMSTSKYGLTYEDMSKDVDKYFRLNVYFE